MAERPAPTRRAGLQVGTQVEVRNRFDGRWSTGFEVAEALGDRYRLVRLSDGEPLPVTIDADDVRRERKRETWWL